MTSDKPLLETRLALVERDMGALQQELRGLREQQKAHHEANLQSQAEQTKQMGDLIASLKWAGVQGIDANEVTQRQLDRLFVRDLRQLMAELGRKTRNTIFTLFIIAVLALAAWMVGVKHPGIFKL